MTVRDGGLPHPTVFTRELRRPSARYTSKIKLTAEFLPLSQPGSESFLSVFLPLIFLSPLSLLTLEIKTQTGEGGGEGRRKRNTQEIWGGDLGAG